MNTGNISCGVNAAGA